MTFRIRARMPDDDDRLLVVWRAAVEASHAFLTPTDVDFYARVVAGHLPQLNDLRVAERADGELLGFVAQDGGEIHMLFVAPWAQGAGVGTALLDDVASAYDEVRLDVNEDNPVGRRFYAAKGFEQVGRSPYDTEGRPFPLLHLRRVRAAGPRDPVLTDRLVLRPIKITDLEDLTRLYAEPQVDAWTGPWGPGAVEAWTRAAVAGWADGGVGKWMAHLRSDQTVVGRGGFSRMQLDGEDVLELGWAIRDELTGQGYATELGRAALPWAAVHFPHLPVISFTEIHNRASIAVMRRLDLRQAGVIHREGLVEGRTGLHPDAPFALYRAR